MSTISVVEIEQDPVGWLRRVEAGETLVVVRDGKPVAEIKPAEPTLRKPRVFGSCAGQFTVPEDFDEPLPSEIIDEFYK